MIKKVALIGLLSLSGLQGDDGQRTEVSDVSYMNPVKKSCRMALWFKAIIPSILSYASLEWVVRANKDNPDSQQFVKVIKWMQWAPFFMGLYFMDQWLKKNFKEWTLSGFGTTPSTP